MARSGIDVSSKGWRMDGQVVVIFFHFFFVHREMFFCHTDRVHHTCVDSGLRKSQATALRLCCCSLLLFLPPLVAVAVTARAPSQSQTLVQSPAREWCVRDEITGVVCVFFVASPPNRSPTLGSG